MKQKSVAKFAWFSIAAAVLTIILKAGAYYLTGSVGLFSDALESLVNLAAAVLALSLLKIAEKPPDEDHVYGHSKAEYFASVIEGILIIIAAGGIIYTSVDRIVHPHPLEQLALGLVISSIAAAVNLATALILLRIAKSYRSITLESDAHHLLTDVWTSIGVLVGLGLVSFTHIEVLDPIVGILIGVNIIVTGIKIIYKSIMGFMDTAIQPEDRKHIIHILEKYCKGGIEYHGLRTRQSAARSFMSVHILVPGAWTVVKGHTLLEEIERDIRQAVPAITIVTHLEPVEDPAAFEDISIDRV